MGTYTGFNTGSDYAFHEPQHPLERIQQRKAASINNDNNDSAFDNIFETHPQSSEQYIDVGNPQSISTIIKTMKI